MNKIEWIFFDIGGVILDDTQIHLERLDLVLRLGKRYKPNLDMPAVYSAYDSASAMHGGVFKNALKLLIGPDNFDSIASEFGKQSPDSRYQQISKVRPEAASVIRRLSKLSKIGLMANQPTSIRNALQESQILELLSCNEVSGDLTLEKPDIRYLEEVLRISGANPSTSILVDDNWARGLLPAQKIGMITVLFERPEMPLNATANPDFRCAGFMDLEQIIKKTMEC